MEFNVELASAGTLCLRTTVSTGTGAPGAWNQEPAFDPTVHVRGYWPFSELTMDGGSVDVKAVQGPPTRRIIEAVATGGPELAAFARTTGDEHGTPRGNRGCYGANLLYDFSVTNSGEQGYPLFVYGQSRNVSNPSNAFGYFGPLSILSPGNFTKRGVTQLRCDGTSPLPGDYVRLTTSDGTTETPVNIPNGQSFTYRIGAAVAGAASAPFNIALSGIAYQLTEPAQ